MWPLRTIIYFIYFWGSCSASLINPIWGVVNYMMVYQLHPPARWWGLPLVAVGMRFSLLATLFIIAGLLISRKCIPKIRPVLSTWEIGILALVGFGALNTVLGVGFDSTAQFAFEKFWKLHVFVLVLARLATTRRNLKIVIWSIVVGSLIMGYDAFTAPRWRFTLGRLDVFGGPDMGTSSGASAHLAAMLPIIGIAFLTAKRWVWRVFAVVAGALTFNAIVLCRTRAAFIALIVGGVAALLMAPRARRYRIHLLLIIAGLLAYGLTDTNYWTRMATLTDQAALNTDPAIVGRAAIWRVSAQILADHPTGVGLGNFSNVIGLYDPRYWHRSSHNTLVMCFVELGIAGGALFLALMAGSVFLVFRSSKRAHLTDSPLETKFIAYGLLVSLVTYIVAGLGTERLSCESLWWVMVFPLCLHRVVLGEARRTVEVPRLVTAAGATDYPALLRGVRHAL